MHPNSMKLMTDLFSAHATPADNRYVIDVGSYNVNGNYRALVEGLGFSYFGVDIAEGPNVDQVVPEIGLWKVPQLSDITISGQCLEHTTRPWEWIRQVKSVTSPGGLLIIIAPWMWEIHRYPVDCWRILPDGMNALFDFIDVESVNVGTDQRDCYGVARLKTSE